jgi:hypothetical protein
MSFASHLGRENVTPDAVFFGGGFVTSSVWISKENTRPSASAKFLIKNFGTKCWFSPDILTQVSMTIGMPIWFATGV